MAWWGEEGARAGLIHHRQQYLPPSPSPTNHHHHTKQLQWRARAWTSWGASRWRLVTVSYVSAVLSVLCHVTTSPIPTPNQRNPNIHPHPPTHSIPLQPNPKYKKHTSTTQRTGVGRDPHDAAGGDGHRGLLPGTKKKTLWRDCTHTHNHNPRTNNYYYYFF